MTYIPLHITATSENVSETTAINNNLWEIDQQLQGFKASNGSNNPPISVTSAEVGMQVYSSYVPDAAGSQLYVSDGTNWHTSDSKETWGAWVPVTDVGPNIFTGNVNIKWRLSNFNRIEWAIYFSLNNTANGFWDTVFEPAIQAAGNRLPWATFGPASIGGSTGPFTIDGQVGPNVLGTGGHGEQLRIAFRKENVSGTDYVHMLYNASWLAMNSNGLGSLEFLANVIYDTNGGYAGCLN